MLNQLTIKEIISAESSLWNAFVASIILCWLLIEGYYYFHTHIYKKPPIYWLEHVLKTIKVPLTFFIFIYLLYVITTSLPYFYINSHSRMGYFILFIISYTAKMAGFLVTIWMIWRIVNALQSHLLHKSNLSNHNVISFIVPLFSKSIHLIIVLLLISILIPELHLNGYAQVVAEKTTWILIILMLGNIYWQSINGLETYIFNQYVKQQDAIIERKIRTRVIILKRIAYAIGIILIISSILLLFESVRKLGAGLLTTAGVVSAILVFASQQSLSRLLSGLQIAFTQPIRIGDTVIIENEFGTIEEISLGYIVVKIWDLRRLILPVDYILTKGFQNLSHTSTQLLGTIFLYVDYTLSVSELREYFHSIISNSSNWDKNVATLQVTEMKETTMEIRVLVSSQDASSLWNLRCEIREKLIEYIAHHHPDTLPTIRQISKKAFN